MYPSVSRISKINEIAVKTTYLNYVSFICAIRVGTEQYHVNNL